MKYALVIYQSPEAFAIRQDAVRGADYTGGWISYASALTEAGVLVGGAGLAGPDTATTLRFGAGQPGEAYQVQDGPFADTKEQLGGLFIIDVPDLDTAMKWAARMPLIYGGSVEVQTIVHATNL